MADQITDCKTYKDGATIKSYSVYYTLDSGDKIVINIDAVDMVDSTDTDEVKTLANAKATASKGHIDATALAETSANTLNGNVTL